MKKIFVIGDGGWGTANALLLASYGHDVTVWGADASYVGEIARTRANPRYLPGVALPASVAWTSEPAAAAGADVVAIATPSHYLGAVCARFRGLIPERALVVSLAKGFCEKTHKRMTDLAASALGRRRVAALSGPSHAEEVARSIPTAVVAAAADLSDARLAQTIWNGPSFRVYASDDVIGVEVGGAVKNVIALAVGISDGLGFGDNTRAALITRGLAEIARFAHALGAQPQTVFGLSGMGDLVVTCTSRHSRNRHVGERLGRGEKIADVVGSMKMVAEGVRNAKVVWAMAKALGVDMPITELVCRVCQEDFPVSEAIRRLMSRPMKGEWAASPPFGIPNRQAGDWQRKADMPS